MAIPVTSGRVDGDVQQLQIWAQKIEVTIQELSNNIARLTNLLQQVISLNNLKSKP